MPHRIQVMLVEDDPSYRADITHALAKEPDILLNEQFSTVEHALQVLESDMSTNIILLDLNLAKMSGVEAIPWIKKYRPEMKIIILSESDHEIDILNAIHLGATGYLLKMSMLEQITRSIRTVFNGDAFLDPRIATFILQTIQSKLPESEPKVKSLLSAREVEILRLLSEGLMKKEISERLQIETTTVATHVRRIYEKLEVPNAPAAITKAYKAGIFGIGD
ncbi:response regulator [Coraliomargarita sp. W4R53]